MTHHGITLDRIKWLADLGVPASRIARDMGCSAAIIRHRLKNGDPTGGHKGHRKWVEKITEVADLRRQRLGYAEIGKRYGVSGERIRQLLRDYGYPDLLGRVFSPVTPEVYEVRDCPQCHKEFKARKDGDQIFCVQWCRMRHRHIGEGRSIIARRTAGERWASIAIDVSGSETNLRTSYLYAMYALQHDKANPDAWRAVFPRVGKQVAYNK